ncbi:hypothetical protein LTR36_000580 [Oleoguttula mirabilis]|uniref:F-box domain-containing protein n=1 Tax=Oleoguttula mirabilis TaxID=1507867 RepID=A0AAV9JQA1_9PEZI|nr:hypothetical protein LTR36_000580 [Oleoguttula mirabilis]
MATTKRGDTSADHGQEGDARPQKRQKAATTRSITTRSMTRASVYNAVLLTTELLENILSYLPMKSLLRFQIVPRKWRAVISESKQLQQALFFLPREADAYWELIRKPKKQLVTISKDEYEKKRETRFVFKSGEANELLFHNEKHAEWDLIDVASDQGSAIYEARFRPSAKHADASWRRMFITQPPPVSIFTHYPYRLRGLQCHNDAYPNGVVASNVWDRVVEAEAEGDTFEPEDGAFLPTMGMLFPSKEEAKLSCFVREDTGDGEGSESSGSESDESV